MKILAVLRSPAEVNSKFNCRLTYTILKDDFKEKQIFNFALNRKSHHLWTVSLKRSILCTELSTPEKTLMWCSTLAEKLYTIRESPHDMNK